MFVAQHRQFTFINRSGKPLNTVITGVHLHQQAGLLVDGRTIIFQMCTVGGANFHQLAASLAHDVRDAERAANLHQLAT